MNQPAKEITVTLIGPCTFKGEKKKKGDKVKVDEPTAAWMAEQGAIAKQDAPAKPSA